jgi:hypothetical protein
MAKISKTARKQALDEVLRGMFGKLQGRQVPDRLRSIVDQLDAADRPPVKKAG